MTNLFTPFYYRDPDELPTPLNIPTQIRQNETPSWNDDEYEDVAGNTYSSAAYTLTYILAGPANGPVSIVATPSSSATSGWTSAITPTIAAKLTPGTYWWQGVLTATNFRLVAGEGQLSVEVDLGASSGSYDGRTVWEKILADTDQAILTSIQSNGLLKHYQIAGRTMEFQDMKQLQDLNDKARVRVAMDLSKRNGGKDRKLLARWSRAH